MVNYYRNEVSKASLDYTIRTEIFSFHNWIHVDLSFAEKHDKAFFECVILFLNSIIITLGVKTSVIG